MKAILKQRLDLHLAAFCIKIAVAEARKADYEQEKIDTIQSQQRV